MSDAMAAAKNIDDLKEAGLSYDQARIQIEFIVHSQEYYSFLAFGSAAILRSSVKTSRSARS